MDKDFVNSSHYQLLLLEFCSLTGITRAEIYQMTIDHLSFEGEVRQEVFVPGRSQVWCCRVVPINLRAQHCLQRILEWIIYRTGKNLKPWEPIILPAENFQRELIS